MAETGELEDPADAIGGGDWDPDSVREELPIREELAVLRREWREMQIEWLSMYDQFRSLYGRISRRQQREAQDADPAGKPQPINPAAARLLGLPQTGGN